MEQLIKTKFQTLLLSDLQSFSYIDTFWGLQLFGIASPNKYDFNKGVNLLQKNLGLS